ncbi:hypothetical protein [Micropruina sonneratiae]|uniref:hypothetical protein n=1 Tax=Micropruina sonneratiae TaxID=2986940 RepID=UPI0022280020|nr:hypothetical protein [Micropruina sp. KQZ13P-5]MCW3156570.1 hypothetical protein [Micropruina sp. KQZ13P-5]
MTTQPPIPPAEGFLDQPDSPESAPSADSAQEGMNVQGTQVIDATKVDPDRIGETEAAPEQ